MAKKHYLTPRQSDKIGEVLDWFDRIGRKLKPRHRRRNDNAGGGFSWFEVTQSPTYADPQQPPTDPLYLGHTTYKLRTAIPGAVVWADGTYYAQGTITTDSGGIYSALVNHTANSASGIIPTNPAYWSRVGDVIEIEIDRCIGFETTADAIAPPRPVRECVPWYVVGEIVPVVTRLVDDELVSYILGAMQWTGAAVDASVRWNATPGKERMTAVYA